MDEGSMTTRRRFFPAALGMVGAAAGAVVVAANPAPAHPRCPLRILDWRMYDRDVAVLAMFQGGTGKGLSRILVNGVYPDYVFYVDLDNGLVGSYGSDEIENFKWRRGKVELFDKDGVRWV